MVNLIMEVKWKEEPGHLEALPNYNFDLDSKLDFIQSNKVQCVEMFYCYATIVH